MNFAFFISTLHPLQSCWNLLGLSWWTGANVSTALVSESGTATNVSHATNTLVNIGTVTGARTGAGAASAAAVSIRVTKWHLKYQIYLTVHKRFGFLYPTIWTFWHWNCLIFWCNNRFKRFWLRKRIPWDLFNPIFIFSNYFHVLFFVRQSNIGFPLQIHIKPVCYIIWLQECFRNEIFLLYVE